MKKNICLYLILLLLPILSYAKTQTAIFAAGCFWCAQSDFDKLNGVVKTMVGFDGGNTPNPTYKEVSSGSTQYVESISVEFDPEKISYPELLDYFWQHIDPTVKDAQFCDEGKQYKSAIFYLNASQKKAALASLAKIKPLFPNIYTAIVPTTNFYAAEEYHQKYYLKNPARYRYYRWSCGRDARIQEVWHAKNIN